MMGSVFTSGEQGEALQRMFNVHTVFLLCVHIQKGSGNKHLLRLAFAIDLLDTQQQQQHQLQ